MITINVSKDFTDTPGARYIKEGSYSGEEFRIKLLEPNYLKARNEGVKLLIDLDGGYGYATSFLEEAFGGLARVYDKNDILATIELRSDDEPGLLSDIKDYINSARDKKKK